MLQACKLEKVERIAGTDMPEAEIKPEGEALVGLKVYILQHFDDFVSFINIWAPYPKQ